MGNYSYFLSSVCLMLTVFGAEDKSITKAESDAFNDIMFTHLCQPAEEALKDVTRIAGETPATARVYRMARAELLYATAKVAQAKAELESLIADHKRFYPAYHDLACLHALAGRNELALRFMKDGCAIGKKHDEFYMEFAGPWFGYTLAGNHKLAEADLKKVLAEPFDANSPYHRRFARQKLADLYLTRSRPKDALKMMEQEQRLEGLRSLDHQEILLTKGRALLLLDRFDEAFRRFAEAMDHAELVTTNYSALASLFMMVMVRELGYQETETLTTYLKRPRGETGYLRLASDLFTGRGDRRDLEALWRTYAKGAPKSVEAVRGGMLLALGDIMRANEASKGIVPQQCIRDALKRLASAPHTRRAFVFIKSP